MNINSIAKFEGSKWAIHKSGIAAVRAAVKQLALADSDDANGFTPQSNLIIVGNVGVICIDGIISQHVSELEAFFGFIDVEDIQDAIAQCEASPVVDCIVLYVNSPGGTVGGIQATAQAVKNASKPVYAFSDSICASAAYWIAAAAPNGVYGTFDADFGSVGVYSFILSEMAYAEKEGYAPTLIKSGKYKAIGIAPVTDDEKEILQAENDEIYNLFKASVLESRPISDDDLQGLTYFGETAINKGFVDGTVNSIDELLEHLQK